jgi:hypothetical protein
MRSPTPDIFAANYKFWLFMKNFCKKDHMNTNLNDTLDREHVLRDRRTALWPMTRVTPRRRQIKLARNLHNQIGPIKWYILIRTQYTRT